MTRNDYKDFYFEWIIFTRNFDMDIRERSCFQYNILSDFFHDDKVIDMFCSRSYYIEDPLLENENGIVLVVRRKHFGKDTVEEHQGIPRAACLVLDTEKLEKGFQIAAANYIERDNDFIISDKSIKNTIQTLQKAREKGKIDVSLPKYKLETSQYTEINPDALESFKKIADFEPIKTIANKNSKTHSEKEKN